jgi:hypothetical protein
MEQRTRRDVLKEVVLQYNRCKRLIRLAGFRLLDQLGGEDEEAQPAGMALLNPLSTLFS